MHVEQRRDVEKASITTTSQNTKKVIINFAIELKHKYMYVHIKESRKI
jgi:hypothetical protein